MTLPSFFCPLLPPPWQSASCTESLVQICSLTFGSTTFVFKGTQLPWHLQKIKPKAAQAGQTVVPTFPSVRPLQLQSKSCQLAGKKVKLLLTTTERRLLSNGGVKFCCLPTHRASAEHQKTGEFLRDTWLYNSYMEYELKKEGAME